MLRQLPSIGAGSAARVICQEDVIGTAGLIGNGDDAVGLRYSTRGVGTDG